MHTPRQKNTFPKFRVCKRQKISSTSTIVGLFHVGYQNDQHITRNIFHPTFKKVPARNPTKDICSYTVLLVGPEVPLRHCQTTYYKSKQSASSLFLSKRLAVFWYLSSSFLLLCKERRAVLVEDLPGSTGCCWLSFSPPLKRTIFSFLTISLYLHPLLFKPISECPTRKCLNENRLFLLGHVPVWSV